MKNIKASSVKHFNKIIEVEKCLITIDECGDAMINVIGDINGETIFVKADLSHTDFLIEGYNLYVNTKDDSVTTEMNAQYVLSLPELISTTEDGVEYMVYGFDDVDAFDIVQEQKNSYNCTCVKAYFKNGVSVNLSLHTVSEDDVLDVIRDSLFDNRGNESFDEASTDKEKAKRLERHYWRFID